MENLLEFIKTDNFLLMSFFINIFLILIVLLCIFKIIKMNKEYIYFMKRLGNGNDLDGMLKKYLNYVIEIKKDNL